MGAYCGMSFRHVLKPSLFPEGLALAAPQAAVLVRDPDPGRAQLLRELRGRGSGVALVHRPVL